MRRSVIIEATKRVTEDIIASGLLSMFSQAVDRYQQAAGTDRSTYEWISFPVITDYISRVAQYSAAELEVMDILDIMELANPVTWQPQFKEADISFIFTSRSKLNNITSFLPKKSKPIRTRLYRP